MPRLYSEEAKLNLNSVQAVEAVLFLLEIHHPNFETPIRLVNDVQDITVLGNLYLACPFEITLPDDNDGQVSKASLSVDNIGRELTQWLEVNRGGQGATCRIMQVMRSNLSVIELDMTLDMSNVSADLMKVSATLEYLDIFNQKAVTLSYRPETQSGLF